MMFSFVQYCKYLSVQHTPFWIEVPRLIFSLWVNLHFTPSSHSITPTNHWAEIDTIMISITIPFPEQSEIFYWSSSEIPTLFAQVCFRLSAPFFLPFLFHSFHWNTPTHKCPKGRYPHSWLICSRITSHLTSHSPLEEPHGYANPYLSSTGTNTLSFNRDGNFQNNRDGNLTVLHLFQ